jgi:hypothetical protein
MSVTVEQQQQQKPDLRNVVRPESSHLAQEVKMANEIACDHVWDKLYPPISVTCSKWYIGRAPFVVGA